MFIISLALIREITVDLIAVRNFIKNLWNLLIITDKLDCYRKKTALFGSPQNGAQGFSWLMGRIENQQPPINREKGESIAKSMRV
jgi:hypothetical protein